MPSLVKRSRKNLMESAVISQALGQKHRSMHHQSDAYPLATIAGTTFSKSMYPVPKDKSTAIQRYFETLGKISVAFYTSRIAFNWGNRKALMATSLRPKKPLKAVAKLLVIDFCVSKSNKSDTKSVIMDSRKGTVNFP
ncbi:MAG: hypothetical protein ABDK94_06770 [Atribacterota bacterium]